MDSKKMFRSEIEKMAKQLLTIRRKKVAKMRTLISRDSYGIKTKELARSLLLSAR